MSNSVLDGRTAAVSSGGTIIKFYTSAARVEESGMPADVFATSLGTTGGGNHFCEEGGNR